MGLGEGRSGLGQIATSTYLVARTNLLSIRHDGVDPGRGAPHIESISPGDRVIAANLELGESTVGVVSRVAYRASKDLVRVVLPGEVIVCTPEHPFWVTKRGWIQAGALQSKDELLSANGSLIEVISVEHDYQPCSVQVFNITVDGCHVYYVGESAVLVHNKQ